MPVKPSYFFGTLFKSISNPSASSPIATATPPAPKSLHFLIIAETFSFLKSRCILCSSGALPFCTSAPHISIDDASCSFDEPVAPPTPSLPVLPPRSIIKSLTLGLSLRTAFLGHAPITAPVSSLLAVNPL